MAHDVFISYSTQDASIAETIYRGLLDAGIACWMAPYSILPGRPWDEAIVEALPASRLLLLLLTSRSNASVQVQKEVELADHYRVPILPVRIENIRPSGSLEYHLARVHWLDAFTPPLEPVIGHLVATVRRLLEVSLPPAAAARSEAGAISATPPAPAPAERATPNNLPAATSALVGRERDAAEVAALLRRQDVRLVTLTGPGGVGKSRLSLQVAGALLADFPDGVTLVPLATVDAADGVVPTIAAALELAEEPGRPLAATLAAGLRDKCHLLLLDNFEQVLDAAGAVEALLSGCPRLKVLVTSRSRLNLTGEQEYPVEPLALPPDAKATADLAAFSQYAAVALFVQRAQAVRRDFAVTAANAPAIAEICARLDGLPLAIELAAARIKVLTPQQILGRLANRLALLTGGARNLPQRQQTLRDAIAWSYDLLTPEEQRLFRRLSVFVGGCTYEAVEAVAGEAAGGESDGLPDLGLDVLDGVASLVEKSLIRSVEQPDGEARYLMLETIREFALARLATSGEEGALQRRHAAACLALVEASHGQLSGPDQQLWIERLDREHDNLRAALTWCAGADPVMGLEITRGLWRFWYGRGHLSEGRRWLDTLLAAAKTAPAVLRGHALQGAGLLAQAQGDFSGAGGHLEESLRLGRQEDDRRGVASTLGHLGSLALHQNDLARAAEHYDESLALCRELGNQEGIAATLHNLGLVAERRGDLDQAAALYEEGLALSRQRGDLAGTAVSLNNLGGLAFTRGDYRLAEQYHAESLAIKRQLGDTWGAAFSLHNLGHCAAAAQDYDRAAALFGEALAIRREAGDRRGTAITLHALGSVALSQGKAGEAAAQLGESLDLWQALENAVGEAACLVATAHLASELGQPETVARLLGAAATRQASTGLPAAADPDREQALTAARTALSEPAFAAAYAAGQAMSIEAAAAVAREVLALASTSLPGTSLSTDSATASTD